MNAPEKTREGVLPSGMSPVQRIRESFSAELVVQYCRRLLGLLRFQPFEGVTEEGRSRERYRRAALTTVTSVLGRLVTVLTWLVTVRLTVRYLGTERYGLWMTITSLVAMMSFADLGIGNGLLTCISGAHGEDNRALARKYVSSAFFALLGTASALVGVFAVVHRFIPWPRVFNVTSALAAREAGPAVFVFLTCFAMNMPLDIVQRVQTGYQEGFETNLWIAAGSLIGLTGLLGVMHFHGGLPLLVLAMSGGPLIAILANWSHEFGWVRPWLLPRWADWDLEAARKVLGTGIMFFVMQVCGVFTVTVDNIIITQILGLEAVTQFTVPMRMFLFLRTIGSMLVIPLWPAYGEALARGDVEWVKKTVRRSVTVNLLAFSPIALLLTLFGKELVRLWVGPQIQTSRLFLAGAAVWVVVDLAGQAMTMFLCGANLMKFQVVLFVATAMANLPAKLFGAKAFGLCGVVWTTALTTIVGTLAVAIYTSKALNKTQNLQRCHAECV